MDGLHSQIAPYIPSRRGVVEGVVATAVFFGVSWAWGLLFHGPAFWLRVVVVLCGAAVAAVFALAFTALRATRSASPPLTPAEVRTQVAAAIDEAAEAGKFRPRPRREKGPTGGWHSATIGIWARHVVYPVPWEAFRDEFRQRRLQGLSGALALSGLPVIVTVTVQSMTQDRILRDVRLEVEGGAVRAFIRDIQSDLSFGGPVTVVDPDATEDPPTRAIFELGNLDNDTPVVLHLVAETASFALEPNDFRWYLYEGTVELGSARYQRIRTD